MSFRFNEVSFQTLLARRTLATCWRDPLRGLRHRVMRSVYLTSTATTPKRTLLYGTYCNMLLSVDDITPRSLSRGAPTCMACVVAEPFDDVLETPT